jgi:hypothetical protein
MKKSGISRLERLVRETVEGSFGRLFGSYLEPVDVATRLVQAMEESDSATNYSQIYRVALHPADYSSLLAQNPDLADDLAWSAWELAQRYDLPIPSKPTIVLIPDENRRRHSVQIVPAPADSDGMPGVDTTQIIHRHRDSKKALAKLLAVDAFLIVQGRRHVDLDKPLITIGRRPDNDIVLDSPEVSRRHAQIRWRFGRFILYDVSGRGRTKVNGEVVTESILVAGDVIALSNAMLVYGEGATREIPGGGAQDNDLGSTQVYTPKRT